MDRSFCWRANHLGFQDANDNRPINDRGRIHRALHEPMGGHPFDGHPQGSSRKGLHITDIPPQIHCTVFEDNSGALELARLPKMRPCTKHINQSFHHFREHVERKDIIVQATPTDEQMADILTKPLPADTFIKHRQTIVGW